MADAEWCRHCSARRRPRRRRDFHARLGEAAPIGPSPPSRHCLVLTTTGPASTCRPGRVRDTRRRLPGMRLSSSGRVFEALVPAILEQLVTGIEARRTWTGLVSRFGEPAPGPAPEGMAVMPSAAGDPLDPRLGVASHRPGRRAAAHRCSLRRRSRRGSRRSARSRPTRRCSG